MIETRKEKRRHSDVFSIPRDTYTIRIQHIPQDTAKICFFPVLFGVGV